tara:strand:+ start:492 stop:641 length:150 start_codon:yes stop_codon:yes gene_type:complete
MTDEQLTRIIEAVETISKETDIGSYKIVDELIGFCWDEEDAFNIKGGLV